MVFNPKIYIYFFPWEIEEDVILSFLMLKVALPHKLKRLALGTQIQNIAPLEVDSFELFPCIPMMLSTLKKIKNPLSINKGQTSLSNQLSIIIYFSFLIKIIN